MKTLNDWKYEIAFNNEKYIDAKNYTLFLNSNEKSVMDAQLEFYRTHFSFDALINKLRTADERRQSVLLLVASKNIKNILHTPNILKQHYLKIINEEFPKYKNTLITILNWSIGINPKVNPSAKLYKKIMGCYMGAIKRKVSKYSKRKMVNIPLNQKLTEFSYIREVRDMEVKMVADKIGQGIFGKYSLYNTQFSYNNLFGFGEYMFGKTTTGGNDQFVINSSGYTLSLNKLHHMIYLNLYPGKGHLINSVYSKSRSNCFDLGASYLVNGWSTFAMWHYNQNMYTHNIKVICGKVGVAFLTHNFEKGYMRAYNFLLGILPKADAMQYLIYMTQYPGLLESYIFGAIATEESINKGFASSPQGLLSKYREVNLGDFFFEYK